MYSTGYDGVGTVKSDAVTRVKNVYMYEHLSKSVYEHKS